VSRRVVAVREKLPEDLLSSIHSSEAVAGLTHTFYRYPARFSPGFADAAIRHFTTPGSVVIDPFMGGGTTIVEAQVLARSPIGVDISELACFISRVKSTIYTPIQLQRVRLWASEDAFKPRRSESIVSDRHQANLHSRQTWAMRKVISQVLSTVHLLGSRRLIDLARCALLRTSQWALDCRRDIPSATSFRSHFSQDVDDMCRGAADLRRAVRSTRRQYPDCVCRPVLLNRSAVGLESDPALQDLPAPDLILTSPPYPGTHVLYHRWQIRGRRETDAPFWISDTNDGQGNAYYTFADRKKKDIEEYYSVLRDAFQALAHLSSEKTWVAQLVSFSDVETQLPRYLESIAEAGFQEITFRNSSPSADHRIWRVIPNRKWYTASNDSQEPKFEAVLFHKLS
jgi:hypothetical protein